AAYYEANRKNFDRPAQVRARQIVVADEIEGQKVLDLLRQGEPFAEVAKEYSLSADAEDGGDLGFFARGEMPPEFDEVVFDL
ncbi:MAG: foldase, partial [Gammaproteobacteria bacterium]|nr:foldase [Gammaproteobacteria bacterium]